MRTWLLDLIATLKINQRQLAARVGVAPASVSRWVNDESLPDPDACRALAALAGVDEGVVMRLAGHMTAEDDAPPTLPPSSATDIARQLLAWVAQQEASQKVLRESGAGGDRTGIDAGGMMRPSSHALRVPLLEVSVAADAARYLLSGEGWSDMEGRAMWLDPEEVPLRSATAPVVGFKVRGDCMAPAVPSGATALIQPTYAAHERGVDFGPGDVVLACVGEHWHLKRLVKVDGRLWLTPDNAGPAIAVTDEVRVVGVHIGTVTWAARPAR